MAIFTLVQAQEFFDAAKEGYLAALKMVEYTIKERSAKRESVKNLYAEMTRWAKYISDLGGSAEMPQITVRRIVPFDDD